MLHYNYESAKKLSLPDTIVLNECNNNGYFTSWSIYSSLKITSILTNPFSNFLEKNSK